MMLTRINPKECTLRMRSFEMIRISAPRSLRSCCIKEAVEATLVKDLSRVSLMHHDRSDLRSLTLTWIIPTECTLRMRSFEMIQISDPRSLGSWCIKGADESTLVKDLVVPLMYQNLCYP